MGPLEIAHGTWFIWCGACDMGDVAWGMLHGTYDIGHWDMGQIAGRNHGTCEPRACCMGPVTLCMVHVAWCMEHGSCGRKHEHVAWGTLHVVWNIAHTSLTTLAFGT